MWADLMGTWSGVLSVLVIVLSALAIPAGILWALLRQFKGPIEQAHLPVAHPPVHHTSWRDSRYSH